MTVCAAAMQLCLALPVVGAVRVGVALGQQVAEQVRVDLELAGQIGQLPVEVFGEGEEVVAMPGEHREDRLAGGAGVVESRLRSARMKS